MTRNGAFNDGTRLLIIERDGCRCVRCGKDLSRGGFNIQHRRARGMGGSRLATTASAANGILLCGSGTTGCHGWVEVHREEARVNGWGVSQWEEPGDVPVLYPNGRFYRLNDDGTRTQWQ